MEILFEDNHLIAVSKDCGQIVQSDKTGDVPLMENVAKLLAEKYQKPGNAFIGLIHRIDRPVSGLLLLAKTSKGLSRMNELFRQRKVQKSYLALVEGNVAASKATLVHYLQKNQSNNKTAVFDQAKPHALEARMDYSIKERLDRYTLLEVQLHSGRHHQIRAQLSHIGHPIKGDVKYGARRANKDKGICLHSYRLAFEHPVSKMPVEIICPLPRNESWPLLL